MLYVVVPARDEAAWIEEVVERTRAALPQAHVLVVDGGSEDDTADRARSAGADLVFQQTRGYPGALREGVLEARRRGASRLVVLDGDGQHPPEAAHELLMGLERANWVTASRAGTVSPTSLRRRVGNRLLAELVFRFGGGRWGDVTSGFHAWDARALEVLGDKLDPNVADANLRLAAVRAGLSTAEVPVAMPEREVGRSMHDGLSGVRNLGKSLRAVWAYRP